MRLAIAGMLRSSGLQVTEADGVQSGLEAFRQARFHAAVVDFLLDDGNAFELLRGMIDVDASVPVIVVTGRGTIPLAVEAMRRGFFHFLTKPFEAVDLLRALDDAIAERPGNVLPDPFTGSSSVVRALSVEAHRQSSSDAPVLLVGEPGTGKGTLAQWLHRMSNRARFPFIRISCAERSEKVLEQELFGSESSTAGETVQTCAGAFEFVVGGSVLLEDVTVASAWIQDRIRQVLVSQRTSRLGATVERSVNFRLFVSSSRPLSRRALETPFLAEVLARSGGSPLRVPALRDRLDDLEALAAAILKRMPPGQGPSRTLTSSSLERLRGYPWPGNLRELRMVLERAVMISDEAEITPHHLRIGDDLMNQVGATMARASLNDVEREHVLQVFRASNQNVAVAAVRLGIPRSTLYQKLREYGETTPRRRLTRQ